MRLQLSQNGFEKLIQTGKIVAPNDDVAQEHFMILVETKQITLYIMNYLILVKKISFLRIQLTG
jgi:hypothetical protein